MSAHADLIAPALHLCLAPLPGAALESAGAARAFEAR